MRSIWGTLRMKDLGLHSLGKEPQSLQQSVNADVRVMGTRRVRIPQPVAHATSPSITTG